MATVLAAGMSWPLLHQAAGTDLVTATAFSLGCAAGLLISPDLDVQTGSLSFTMMRRSLRRLKRLGPVLAFAWQWFWQPYARLIPRHRHPLSHFPIIGTLGRLAYLVLVTGALYWMLQSLWTLMGGIVLLVTGSPAASLPHLSSLSVLAGQSWLWWWVGGLALVDTLHTLMDWFWPFK